VEVTEALFRFAHDAPPDLPDRPVLPDLKARPALRNVTEVPRQERVLPRAFARLSRVLIELRRMPGAGN
jgi:hypothetical protein